MDGVGQDARIGSDGFGVFFESMLGDFYALRIFALPIGNGPVAQLNRALDYGSRGFRFES